MKIKTIKDVIPYLENFYDMTESSKDTITPSINRIGRPHQEINFSADPVLFKNPEKILSKMMISYIIKTIDHEYWCYRKENDNKDTIWVIEWRIKPEYEEANANRRCASVYARFSVYPRSAVQQNGSE